MHEEEKADIELMQFISERMPEMRDKADVLKKMASESKAINIAKLEARSGLQVSTYIYSWFCSIIYI